MAVRAGVRVDGGEAGRARLLRRSFPSSVSAFAFNLRNLSEWAGMGPVPASDVGCGGGQAHLFVTSLKTL
eukprot:2299783-Rhodomonas_salina.1